MARTLPLLLWALPELRADGPLDAEHSCDVAPVGDSSAESFRRSKDWAVQHGSFIHEALAGADVVHEGVRIRGIVATADIAEGETLMHIPPNLWLERMNVQEFRDAHDAGHNVSAIIEPCINEEDREIDVPWRLDALAVAVELGKGEASFWATTLRVMPSLASLREHHPQLAAPELLREFPDLPLAEYVLQEQESLMRLMPCIEQMPFEPPSLEQFRHGMLVMITRSYVLDSANNRNGVVPVADLMNTGKMSLVNSDYIITFNGGPRTEAQYVEDFEWYPATPLFKYPNGSVLIDWDDESGYDRLKQGHEIRIAYDDFRLLAQNDVAAGDELLDYYCLRCDNERMLKSWAMYLETEPKVQSTRPPAAKNCGEELKQTVVAMLGEKPPPPWRRSPRCIPERVQQRGGIIRCGLARLAWETCARSWGLETSDNQLR